MNYIGFYSDIKQGFTQAVHRDLPQILAQKPSLDPVLIDMVGDYLSGGYVLGDILSTIRDPFSPDLTLPMGTRTDGEWVWPADAAVLCKRHGIIPGNPDFLAKVQNSRGVCPKPTVEQLDDIKTAWYK